MDKIPSLKIGDLIAKIPIIQGGMGVGISLSGLASAVANEGGIGIIATPGVAGCRYENYSNNPAMNNKALREEIQKARQNAPKGIIGVNIMVALSNYEELVKTSLDEGVDLIISGAGLPLNLPAYLDKNKHKTKLVPIVSSDKAASIICRKWLQKADYLPDAVVVEGPLAGGHLGFSRAELDNPELTLENIFPKVVEMIKTFEDKYNKKIPVIAAGGIYTGADIKKFFKLGASGVQMATRFVATKECDASEDFKKAYINAREEDIVIIQSPVGLPGRVIRNQFIDDVKAGKTKPFKCPFRCISSCNFKEAPYCIAQALLNARKGNLAEGFAFAGYNAYRTTSIISVKDLIAELVSQFEAAE